MFHIPADPDHLMIAGLSMGGFGALHAALSEPGVFTAVGSFSGSQTSGHFSVRQKGWVKSVTVVQTLSTRLRP